MESKMEEKQDFLLNLEELRTRVQSGDSGAQYLLGRSLYEGWNDCVINSAESFKWIESAKKDEKSPGGLCAQGYCYEHAIGGVTIKNLEKAKTYYSQAAEKGYIPGRTDLANLMYDEARTKSSTTSAIGSATHLSKDQEKLSAAVKLLTPCAEAGYIHAIYSLAWFHLDGSGVPEDTKEAIKLFDMAARKGHSDSKRMLGKAYFNGWGGLKQSNSTASMWYKSAAKQGRNVKPELQNIPSSCNIV